ncbi:MAG: sigma 54-interacting transcriptional regulator [Gammaproteobacteria bacterium]|nr:sigma 54-interacting transcriptional regulator [Gammaproteobacteria bacterium]
MVDLSPTLQALIDAQQNPFVLIDPEYRIVAANNAYQAAYGLEAIQIVGRYCYELSHRRTAPCHQHGEDCPHRQVLASGKECQVLHTHYDQQGSAEHVQIKGLAIPLPDGGYLVAESIFRLAAQPELNCDEMRLIGRSPAFLRAVEQLTLAAASHANILLHGESGVGKELAAHYMHRHSPRRNGPFLAVDCGAISETLFESEIFGHERGAFTGCVGRKQGLFELADGGTLFLDEVGELSLAMQAKLLRVMESGEFRRVGGREVLHADVRVIGATNRNLMTMVESGGFREDLYYRLACITIELPPLRARRSDIPALAEALLVRINQANGSRLYLTGEALDRLIGYDFPGNVRELRNILQRAAALSAGSGNGSIGASAIRFDGVRAAAVHPEETGAKPQMSAEGTPTSIRAVERSHIAELLERFSGHRRAVADALGISERTLYRKLRRYELG